MSIAQDRFEQALARYGPVLENWPADERAMAETVLAQDAAARTLLAEEQALEALLETTRVPVTPRPDLRAAILAQAHRQAQLPAPDAAPDAAPGKPILSLRDAVARVFGRLSPLGPVWTQGAALASIAALGFVLGLGAAPQDDVADTQSTIAAVDDTTLFLTLAFGGGDADWVALTDGESRL